jgi:hypothetical protein
MKGMFCGTRALALACSLIVVAAAAPGLAKADATGTGVTAPAAVTVPAVPAAPAAAVPASAAAVAQSATPQPAAPQSAAPQPAAPQSAAPQSAAPQSAVSGAPVQVTTTPVQVTAKTTPTVSVGIASPVVDLSGRPGAIVVRGGTKDTKTTAALKQAVAASSSAVVKKANAVRGRVAKQSPVKPTVTTNVKLSIGLGRAVQGSYDSPMGGCLAMKYQICQSFPDFTYVENNDCNNEQIPFTGTLTVWMQVTTNVLSGTITTHQRTYFVGFHGQGDQGNIYNGQDTQNDFSRQFALGPVVVDHRDYEVLLVTKKNPLDPAPNQYMYVRTVTRVDPADPAHPQISVYGPYVVCQMGKMHSHDSCSSSKNDDDGDSNKHHHSQQYSSYNDDQNSWDD